MRGAGRRVMLSCILTIVATLTACARIEPLQPGQPPAFDGAVELNGAPLRLHLSPGVQEHRDQLVVYATGDGGWRGKDRELFSRVVAWGYAAVGFSSPEYLKHLPGDDGTTTPGRVGLDFRAIVNAARGALQVADDAPVVLVGVSRGADLAVVAAGQRLLQDELGGVVVMGLTREEEYVRRRRSTVALELYPYLPRLGEVPVSVIQSTRDNYLSADEARALFGADTPLRQLHPIEAQNHSFGGARDRLYAALRASLTWVDRLDRLALR